jgi:chemotaxis protein methyltransferase CheR
MRQTMSDAEYRWFSEWIIEEFGLVFGPEKKDILRARLEPRRAELGFETFEQLYFHLKYHPEREREREKLIPYLTNNESYFFRETQQLDVLRDEILAAVKKVAQAKGSEVRILSAGCASGEEAYTLAMIAHDSHLFPPGSMKITGIDLDPDALDRARRAVYGPNAFRRTDPAVRDKYFTPVGPEKWSPLPRLQEMVAFDRANLADGAWTARLANQDVIFCRNVLIYFGEDTTRFVADSFYKALRPGGYLFLGHAETLSRTPTRFETLRRPGCVFYRKPEVQGG